MRAIGRGYGLPELQTLSRETIAAYLRAHQPELKVLAANVLREDINSSWQPATGCQTTRQRALAARQLAAGGAGAASSNPRDELPRICASTAEVLRHIVKPGAYLGAPSLHAAERIAQRPIHVIEVGSDGSTPDVAPAHQVHGQLEFQSPLSGAPLFLAFLNQNHFEPMLPPNLTTVFFAPEHAWLNSVQAVRLAAKSKGGSGDQFELQQSRSRAWQSIPYWLALEYIDLDTLSQAAINEGAEFQLRTNFLRSRNFLNADQVTHMRARQLIIGQDTLCPSCASAPVFNAGNRLLRTSVTAAGLLVKQCGNRSRCKGYPYPKALPWRFELGQQGRDGMEWFHGSRRQLNLYCNTKDYNCDRDARDAMTSFKNRILNANKMHLSSEQHQTLNNQLVATVKVLQQSQTKLLEAKTSRMPAVVIAELQQRLEVVGRQANDVEALVAALPTQFAIAGSKVTLPCGARSQAALVPVAEGALFTGTLFASTAPAGRLRCGADALASALLLANDPSSADIVAGWDARMDIDDLSSAVYLHLQPKWRTARSSVADALDLACHRKHPSDTLVAIRCPTAFGFHIVVVDCNRAVIYDNADKHCRRAPSTTGEWLTTLRACAGADKTPIMKDLRVVVISREYPPELARKRKKLCPPP